MIEFSHLTYRYPTAQTPILRDITLVLPEGCFALIVGESGAGKSTLLRCINGLVPHFSGGQIQGSIHVAGFDPIATGPTRLSQVVGFVFQDPEAQSVMERVEDEIAFGLEQAGLDRQAMRIRVEEVLDLLDLAHLRDRALETLSGGERQRVAIASALALRPRILVLDEPTSQLDPQSAEDVLRALERLNTDLGLTIVLAEQRLERVLPFVDLLVVLDRNTAGVRVGPPAELLAELPFQPPIIRLAMQYGWRPLPLRVKEALRFARSVPRVPSTSQPELLPPARQAPAMLSIQSVYAGYGTQSVLHGVSLDLHAGEIAVLLGRSGSGKSTLLKTIVGLVQAQRGQIRIAGKPTTGRSVADLASQVAYLPQDPNMLLFAETVRDELLTTLRNHSLAPAGPHNPDALLAELGLSQVASAYPRDLSAGERQRVALAAVTITRPALILLDEPTRGLDYHAKHELAQLLERWRTAGLAILLVTHDVEFAAQIASTAHLLARGELIASGPIATILGNSPLFATQTARIFPERGWLIPEDAT